MPQKTIVVLGAGVAGLTTALLLSQHRRYNVIVVAKHMPGDYDIEYASPWAGANYMPVGARGSKPAKYEQETWPYLENLARNCPEAGVHFQECFIYSRVKDTGSATATWFRELLSPNAWFKDVVPNFRRVPSTSLDPEIDTASVFTSVCINTAIYLPWLVSSCLKHGVIFKRAEVNHIVDSTSMSLHPDRPIDLVVNCTGLGAAKLGGVQDSSVVPARGQIVLVRNVADKMLATSGTDDGEDEACYVMTRAAGGGTILGGCYQKGSWDARVDPSLAKRIMERAVAMCPSLTGGRGIEHLDIVRHGVGLRPVREQGVRIETEFIDGTCVVHNYGAGGAGFQNSYGCAQAAVELVYKALGQLERL